jgi:hypothetical protein
MRRTHAGRQPEEIGAQIRRLLGELVDLREQQRKTSSKEDDVVSRLQGTLRYIGHSTQRNLFDGDKLSRWGDRAGACGPDDHALSPKEKST